MKVNDLQIFKTTNAIRKNITTTVIIVKTSNLQPKNGLAKPAL